jgi:formimidoylglutamate deiminase
LSSHSQHTAWLPELTYARGRFRSGLALVTDGLTGRVVSLARADGIDPAWRVVRLPGRALLPGMVNAHSHAFQRAIRGRTEFRTSARDTFWTWREMMYRAAERLSPEDLYDASRMAFMEMALSGITSVGEFHYLHHDARANFYDDPNLLSKQVVRAARDVGIRIALLRVAYARAGFRAEPNPRQSRFITPAPADFLKHLDALSTDLARDYETRSDDDQNARASGDAPHPGRDSSAASGAVVRARGHDASAETSSAAVAWVGVAPHSVRAVPLDYLREVCAHARARQLVVHMHVAEQPAENEACVSEHGRTPVQLLADENLLGERFTAVHAVHVTADEARALARANVCACPTTERNLGDGVVPADLLFDAGVRVALGTDSHAQIDLLEDARELEYHLRLQKLSRAVLAPHYNSKDADRETADAARHDGREINAAPRLDAARADGDHEHSQTSADVDARAQTSALAARLFDCTTAAGARSLGFDGGELRPGAAADFFTVALDDPSIAGASRDDLLPAIVFSLARAAVRETAVGGRLVVEQGRHPAQDEIVSRFAALQRGLWS